LNDVSNESLIEDTEINNNLFNLANENKEINQINESKLNEDTIKIKELTVNNQIQESKIRIEKPKSSNSNAKQTNGNKGNSIFNRIILPQIRKQIEFYFSDKNYYHDAFLVEKATENSDNCKNKILLN
jgi:hypothetical protein